MYIAEHVSGAGSERGAERAKYSWSAERVFIQRPERSLCLAPVPLQYRSHHEPRACTNPPRIHLCLQQLTKLSAYTSKIVRCEGEMEFVKYFQKQTDRSYRCTIPVKKLDDNDVEHEQECCCELFIGYRLRGGRVAERVCCVLIFLSAPMLTD